MGPSASAAFTPPGVVLSTDESVNLGGRLFLNGQLFLHNDGDPLRTNTALGIRALNFATNSGGHTAIGNKSLYTLTGGGGNTAIGNYALYRTTQAYSNVAIGETALYNNHEGFKNVAVGSYALGMNYDGVYNIAIGTSAGSNIVNSSLNILIGNTGTLGDQGVLRIGTVGDLSKAYIAGIRDITTGAADALPVFIDSNGQLGTVSSSRRYKEEIRDMADVSAGVLDLRPVTFRYREAFSNGAKPRQFGLLAEEVAEAFPELAVLDENGQPETVKYHLLSTLLLNEVQKQDRRIRFQGWILTALFATTLALLVGRLKAG